MKSLCSMTTQVIILTGQLFVLKSGKHILTQFIVYSDIINVFPIISPFFWLFFVCDIFYWQVGFFFFTNLIT